MANQATVSGGNGVNIHSPAGAVVGGLAEFGNDIATLAELQLKLTLIDLKEATARAAVPAAITAGAIALLLGAVPVVLLGVAWLLVDYAHLRTGWALLIVGVLSLVLAAVLAWTATPRLKKSLEAFRRSQEELKRNVSWIRTVLVHSGRPAARPRR